MATKAEMRTARFPTATALVGWFVGPDGAYLYPYPGAGISVLTTDRNRKPIEISIGEDAWQAAMASADPRNAVRGLITAKLIADGHIDP